jgi:glutamyl-tRNA synthetase
MDKIILNAIRIEALKNAVKFNGKCNPKSLVGAVIKSFPEAKENMSELVKEINIIAKDVNSIDLDKQKAELLAFDSSALDKKPKQVKKDLFKELNNVDKKKGVIMRLSPSPSGPMHIGHVFTGMPTSIYVERYGGKFILRIEDTNPENIYAPAYDLLKKDADWVFGNITEVWIQSDRIKNYYSYAEKLINTDAAYVCDCDNEKFKKLIQTKQACPCRSLSKEENMKRWNKMLDPSGYKQGEVVLRFKADLENKNPALRDFPLARINEAEHPRQGRKYRVWPLMNLAVTVDDIEAGMTHIIRAKDHQTNAERQKMIYDSLGIKNFPENMFLGRWNFEGLEISCSKTREKINTKIFNGWDDIRIPFILALKRRGYQAEAFRNFVKQVGITPNDKKMSGLEFFKVLDAYNKDIIDSIAKRFFFIPEPIKTTVENAVGELIELNLHPDNIKGGRKFQTSNKFLLSKTDIIKIKNNSVVRLMDCLNFVKQDNKFVFDSLDYETYKEKNGKQIIHWLPDDNTLIDVEVLMPTNLIIKGKAESNLDLIKVGDVIQFERFGFCRLDSIEKNVYKFWFTHK